MLGLAGVPSTLQFIGMLMLPESPRWLSKELKNEAAKEVMQKIYKPESLDRAMDQLSLEV